MYTNLQEMLQAAQQQSPKIIAIAVAEDEDVLQAAKLAEDAGLARFILVGDAEKITSLQKKVGLSAANTVVPAATEEEALQTAVGFVRQGKAHLLMKGFLNTSPFLKGVLNAEWGLRTGRLLSHLAAYDLPKTDKVVFHADTGMNIAPNLAEKVQILCNSVEALRTLGVPCPNVAVLAANEQVHPKMPASVDAAELVKMAQAGELPPMHIEGPIAMDVALNPEAAHHKKINSAISGQVDLFLVSSIEVGNIMGKALIFYANARVAGVVLGAACPIVLTSRAEPPEGKLHSIALACLLASSPTA